ncbi:transcriptional regulator [Skermanella stibiiresistens SB22]|uniref:Transcriptional regulator n=1 Tax=Skermanella stibiiresistens SB22 TaxID=1385369 RepID=W9GXZ5_9PROT|nr:response regulator transcription factor [Skermanella stibiiresistens]EWY36353.1 transcriptional regulator [Skermanella stibiiresistens SB22]
MCKVLIADDHPLFRDALKTALSLSVEGSLPVEASNLEEAIDAIRSQGDFDLALLDLSMPGVNGFSGLLTLRAQFPSLPVVIVSAHEDSKLVHQAIDYGAVGFIPKSTPRDQIAEALRAVIKGDVYIPPNISRDEKTTACNGRDDDAEIARRITTLTAQQLRVLEMLGTGKLNKEIAFELNIAETTVKAHVSAILQKLKVYSRTQAVVFASKLHFDTFQSAR